MRRYYHLGYEVDFYNGEFYYLDTGKYISEETRPCNFCGEYITELGHDPCIANLPGVVNACCGHGVKDGFIEFENGTLIRGIQTNKIRSKG